MAIDKTRIGIENINEVGNKNFPASFESDSGAKRGEGRSEKKDEISGKEEKIFIDPTISTEANQSLENKDVYKPDSETVKLLQEFGVEGMSPEEAIPKILDMDNIDPFLAEQLRESLVEKQKSESDKPENPLALN